MATDDLDYAHQLYTKGFSVTRQMMDQDLANVWPQPMKAVPALASQFAYTDSPITATGTITGMSTGVNYGVDTAYEPKKRPFHKNLGLKTPHQNKLQQVVDQEVQKLLAS